MLILMTLIVGVIIKGKSQSSKLALQMFFHLMMTKSCFGELRVASGHREATQSHPIISYLYVSVMFIHFLYISLHFLYRNVQEMYRKYIGNVQEMYREYIRNVQEMYGEYIRNVSEIYRKWVVWTIWWCICKPMPIYLNAMDRTGGARPKDIWYGYGFCLFGLGGQKELSLL